MLFCVSLLFWRYWAVLTGNLDVFWRHLRSVDRESSTRLPEAFGLFWSGTDFLIDFGRFLPSSALRACVVVWWSREASWLNSAFLRLWNVSGILLESNFYSHYSTASQWWCSWALCKLESLGGAGVPNCIAAATFSRFVNDSFLRCSHEYTESTM